MFVLLGSVKEFDCPMKHLQSERSLVLLCLHADAFLNFCIMDTNVEKKKR